jgi:hypothetical protein
MRRTCHRLVIVALVATGPLLGGFSGRPRAEESPTTGLSKVEFGRLCRELDLKKQPWARIRWRVSVTEARLLAAKEQKPIFLVVNTGNCLGWT